MLLAEGTNSLNLTDEQFQVIVNKSVAVVNEILQNINNEIMLGMCLFEVHRNIFTGWFYDRNEARFILYERQFLFTEYQFFWKKAIKYRTPSQKSILVADRQ